MNKMLSGDFPALPKFRPSCTTLYGCEPGKGTGTLAAYLIVISFKDIRDLETGVYEVILK